jgi:glutathione S-transferase
MAKRAMRRKPTAKTATPAGAKRAAAKTLARTRRKTAAKASTRRAALKKPAPKPTLYGMWPSGPTYKVGLALSLMGQPFAYEHVNLREGAHKKPEYLALNRYGQVPCLVDGKTALCQSAAILEYLAGKHGKLGGGSEADKLRIREWMFWSFDRLAPPIYRLRGIKRGMRKGGPDIEEMYANEAAAALGVLDQALAERDWLVGRRVSIADVDAYGVVAYAGEAGVDLAPYANVVAWVGRIEGLKGYGKYADVLPQESRA